MNKKYWIVCIIIFVLISGGAYILLREPLTSKSEEISTDIFFSEEIPEEPEKPKEPEAQEQTIEVYICGAVEKPGVYTLKSEERLNDLLVLCGGLCKAADIGELNLAATLEDGEKVNILTKKEVKMIKKESEKKSESGTDNEADSEDGKVDINVAAADLLMTLPGIGESKAKSIIAYREENGAFKSPEDIMQIVGIKSGVYDKIKDYIKV